MKTVLSLPQRSTKPRAGGRTAILDKGTPLGLLEDQLQLTHEAVDLAKLGWGTSIVTPKLEEKLALYRRFGIDTCFGGTLFELVWLRGKMDDYVSWLRGLGMRTVEVSDGTVVMPAAEKLALIERLARDFEVYSEVGGKDAATIVSPAKWVRAIKAELNAGAAFVILEGRESGTAGLYRETGEIRTGLVDDIIESGIEPRRLVFEAPRKAQQVWLLQHVGLDANLGNIPLEEIISLETLRLGLRSDTLLAVHHRNAAVVEPTDA